MKKKYSSEFSVEPDDVLSAANTEFIRTNLIDPIFSGAIKK